MKVKNVLHVGEQVSDQATCSLWSPALVPLSRCSWCSSVGRQDVPPPELRGYAAVASVPSARRAEAMHCTRAVLLYGFVAAVFGLGSCSATPFHHSHAHARVIGKDHQVFYDKASQNLTMWKSTLYERVSRLYSTTTRGSSAGQHYGKTFNIPVIEPYGAARYSEFNPFVSCPPSQSLGRVGGEGDGGKIVCGLDTLSAPCLVYSLGSNMDFSFEQGVLDSTPCDVHTFDCTVDGEVLDAERHAFHKLCIGSNRKQSQDSNFITLDKAVEQFTPGRVVDLLKVDIEGFEHDLFASWTPGNPSLPKQMSFEVHYATHLLGATYISTDEDFLAGVTMLWNMREITLAELALFMSHMGDLGYGIVSKELNAGDVACCEFTVLKVK